ncbi:uncharacterized protein PRCAT00001259001 [Priceomyces carsonii]|uniref:uncharacterized protein n=1 Tax=Priceomyces carsonii TaxID=28549 RepID=UPI002ED7E9B8|nr:unnamed protein product [Priceomyces carsonii]
MTDLTYTIQPLEDFPRSCKKCCTPIQEGHAYELGDDRWHIHCFKCSKCDSSLGCNSNFLVLGNGNLICSNCSYNCKQCNKKIDDLAILTGDQAYCSNCFKCRSCKTKIEDLRYARTSKGLFCMSCHEKLIAKKKKYDAKKRRQAQLKDQGRGRDLEPLKSPKGFPNLHGDLTRSNSSVYTMSSKNKGLPSAPLETSNASLSTQVDLTPPNAPVETYSRDSFQSAKTEQSLASLGTSQLSNTSNETTAVKTKPVGDLTIEEINDSDDELNLKRQRKILETVTNPTKQVRTPPLSTERVSNNESDRIRERIADQDNGSLFLDIIDIPPSPPRKDKLQSPADFGDSKDEEISYTADRSPAEKFRGKNLLLLSPNQFHDNGFHHASHRRNGSDAPGTSSLAAPVDDRIRSNCSSPLARANRQARVVETNDFMIDNQENLAPPQITPSSTPKRSIITNVISSPPPRAPLPSVPSEPSTPKKMFDSTPKSTDSKTFKNDQVTPRGLGLEGVNYDEKENYGTSGQHLSSPRNLKAFGNNTPTVTNLEESTEEAPIKRKNTLGKKIGIKHKRSISGGNGGITGKLGFFKSNSSKNGDMSNVKGHSRHVSDSSVSGGSAFTTPPLPLTTQPAHSAVFKGSFAYRDHVRASSDTPFLTSLEQRQVASSELALDSHDSHMGRIEILKNEIRNLELEKQNLGSELDLIHFRITAESETLDSLLKKVETLELKQKSLIESNHVLVEQNQQLENALKHHVSSNISYDHLNGSANSLSNNDTGSERTTPATNLAPLSSSLSNNRSSSSSSLPPVSHNIDNVNDDANGETQRATRLRFWRRPKLSFNSPSINSNTSPQLQFPQQQQPTYSNGTSRLTQTYGLRAAQVSPHKQSNGIHQNDNLQVIDKKGIGSFITKSKSSHLLDTILTGSNSSSSAQSGNTEANALTSLFDITIQERADYEQERIPIIITKCIAEVERRGLDMEGIYRISGGNSAIVSIETAFASLPSKPTIDDKQMLRLEETLNGDVNAITSALKRYFRKLPDPLIPFALYDDYIRAGSTPQVDKKIEFLKSRVIDKLPPANKHALYVLCKHLGLINQYSYANRMGYKNLSVVFAPTLSRAEDGQREINDTGPRNDSTEVLLQYWEKIFEGYS